MNVRTRSCSRCCGPVRFLLLALAFLLLPAAAGADEESCVQLLNSRCQSCHYESRICRKLQKSPGRRSWQGTIKRMVRHGAQLKREEQLRLAACLAQQDSEILDLCGRKPED